MTLIAVIDRLGHIGYINRADYLNDVFSLPLYTKSGERLLHNGKPVFLHKTDILRFVTPLFPIH